jgi:hypothetical protein
MCRNRERPHPAPVRRSTGNRSTGVVAQARFPTVQAAALQSMPLICRHLARGPFGKVVIKVAD